MMIVIGSSAYKLFRRNKRVPIAIALVSGMGIGNLFYLVCFVINIGYYIYYTYSIFK